MIASNLAHGRFYSFVWAIYLDLRGASRTLTGVIRVPSDVLMRIFKAVRCHT